MQQGAKKKSYAHKHIYIPQIYILISLNIRYRDIFTLKEAQIQP